jgi:iron complex outermembrane recepter protein
MKKSVLFAVAVSPIALCNHALAQDAQVDPQANDTASYSEIVVTAQRREERSVDVPITVTTLSAEVLETANARDLADISKVTPGLRFDAASSFVQPTIRGIGTAVANSGGGANVGIYIDGFYSPNPIAANVQLMNVQSVQVLKGPQGTLFGRNTTGGAILIQTAEPREEPGGRFKLSYGRFNALEAQFYGTTGIAPGIAFDVEGLFRHGSGFQTNIVNNDDRVSEYTEYAIRTGAKVDLGDSASLLVRYQHSESRNPGPTNANTLVDPEFGLGAPFFLLDMNGQPAVPGLIATHPDQVAQDGRPFVKVKTDIVQATLKADLGFADLTSYTQYRSEEQDQSLDLDFTAATVFQIGIPVNDRTISQEFLLTSKPGSRLQWTAGLYYLNYRDHWFTYADSTALGILRAPDALTRIGGSSTTTKSYAAFVDMTYEIVPQLFVTAGARYAHDEITDAFWTNKVSGVVQDHYVPSIKSDKVTPRIVLRYKPSDDASIYASYTMGYKAAIIDIGGSCQRDPDPTDSVFTCNPIQPETINAWEIGAKFRNRTLSFEASAFYYDYKNLQISSYVNNAQANITNAASSEIYGLEGAVSLRVSPSFEISAGAAWTHARYKTFVDAPVYEPCPDVLGAAFCGANGLSFVVPGMTLTNVPMQRSPEFTGNIGAVYRTGLGGGEFQMSGNLAYTSKFFFGPSGTQFPQEGFETLSARAQWTDSSGQFTLGIWGDNLTNNRHRVAVQYNSFGFGASWNAPVTFGGDISFKF